MYPNTKPARKHYYSRNPQQGLGLPIALFVIVIMSLIAVAVNQLGESSSQAYLQNVISTQAFYAAESGAQLRAKTVLIGPPCVCGPNIIYTFDDKVKGLNHCRAETTCTSFVANTETYCTIISTGKCDNSNAERTIEVRIK